MESPRPPEGAPARQAWGGIRVWSLCKKETLQVLRDPSTLLISLVFPVILLLVFGTGINLDTSTVRLGVLSKDSGAAAQRFVRTLTDTPSFVVTPRTSTAQLSSDLRAGRIQGFVVISSDFSESIVRGGASHPTVQVITDGAEPNAASLVSAYVRGVHGVFLREESARRGTRPPSGLALETRSWFNPSTKSRNSLLPGSITIILTVVGALLTALVIAREWERGTMEALLAAGVTRTELIVSKLLPYFALGQVSFWICIAMTRFLFSVPLRGSLGALFIVGSAFLLSALGLGLLLSSVLRNQYNAAQAALNVAFLPALMLSGFVFEISSMPAVIRAVTAIVPARYFVTGMQTIFQAGDVWSVLGPSLGGLTLAAVGFIGLTFLNTRRRLE